MNLNHQGGNVRSFTYILNPHTVKYKLSNFKQIQMRNMKAICKKQNIPFH